MSVLKTAFPLLALSMETMGDQISKFFKCPPDEDAYRLIVALLNDGLQYIGRHSPHPEHAKLPPTTESNITRFAETILPPHIRVGAVNTLPETDLLTSINRRPLRQILWWKNQTSLLTSKNFGSGGIDLRRSWTAALPLKTWKATVHC